MTRLLSPQPGRLTFRKSLSGLLAYVNTVHAAVRLHKWGSYLAAAQHSEMFRRVVSSSVLCYTSAKS